MNSTREFITSKSISNKGHTEKSPFRLMEMSRIGQSVNLAIVRFITVGETIADDYSEIRQDMYEACKEARKTGTALEHICEEIDEERFMDKTLLIRAAKCLISAVTRILLLADIIVVKQLLLVKDKMSQSLERIESVNVFSEFVEAFSQFGAEMLELAYRSSGRQNNFKDERRRAQIVAARQVLERSTLMLLAASKTCLRHPDCSTARENRDTVFCQMRRAMDLIHYVIKDSIISIQDQIPHSQTEDFEYDRGAIYTCMHQLQSLLEYCKTATDISCHQSLTSIMDAILERTQDFTDSPYTSHEHREAILDASGRLKEEIAQLLNVNEIQGSFEGDVNTEVEDCIETCIGALRNLFRKLANAAIDQAHDLRAAIKQSLQIANHLRQNALSSDINSLAHTSDKLQDSIDYILEVCKLLRHVAVSETLQVAAKFTEINLRVYGPQVITAARTLSLYPDSSVAGQNLDVFIEVYKHLLSDIVAIVKDVLSSSQLKPEKKVYMSLPRPGKHGKTPRFLKDVNLDSIEQEKIARSGLEMKLATCEMEAETEKWRENDKAHFVENNEIVKRAKTMSSMAFSMYRFTKGEGSLKTTQDLFTQAEYFAEEANKLYKVIRQFSYQVPGGSQKKELLESLDKVPTYVQRLQFSVKDHTVGKAATFVKVDNVIQETKTLMNVISKVVTVCFDCATKYKLEFRGDGNGTGRGVGAEGSSSSSAGVSGDNKGGAASGSDQSL